MNTEALNRLTATLTGSALTPDSPGYAAACQVWNGTVSKRPAIIVQCEGVPDVVAAVNFAREQGLQVSVRGGGHHVAGSALVDDGLVVDLSRMRSVQVHAGSQTVRCEGGALIGDLDRETQAFGLAVPMGVVSETGIAGLTLGGGIGWLRRKHGLSCDNLLSAQVVTADGRVVHAGPDENRDLIWALRGGGWDLGVVTSLEYQAYPLGPDVWVTFIGYEWSDAKQVLQGFRDFAATAPDGFSALCVCWTVPEIDDFPKDAWGKPFVVIVGPYAGTVDEGQAVTKPLASLGNVLGDLSGAMPYVEAQKALFDEDYPSGDRYYWRSTYIRELSDQVIDALIDLTESRPSPRSSLDIWLMGGEIDRKDPHHAAFGARGAPYLIGIEANWSDPATDADNFAWTRAAGNRMAPFSTGASYLNFEDPDDARATQAAHGGGFDQLLKVKQEYDPQNLFRSRRGLAAEP